MIHQSSRFRRSTREIQAVKCGLCFSLVCVCVTSMCIFYKQIISRICMFLLTKNASTRNWRGTTASTQQRTPKKFTKLSRISIVFRKKLHQKKRSGKNSHSLARSLSVTNLWSNKIRFLMCVSYFQLIMLNFSSTDTQTEQILGVQTKQQRNRGSERGREYGLIM